MPQFFAAFCLVRPSSLPFLSHPFSSSSLWPSPFHPQQSNKKNKYFTRPRFVYLLNLFPRRFRCCPDTHPTSSSTTPIPHRPSRLLHHLTTLAPHYPLEQIMPRMASRTRPSWSPFACAVLLLTCGAVFGDAFTTAYCRNTYSWGTLMT